MKNEQSGNTVRIKDASYSSNGLKSLCICCLGDDFCEIKKIKVKEIEYKQPTNWNVENVLLHDQITGMESTASSMDLARESGANYNLRLSAIRQGRN